MGMPRSRLQDFLAWERGMLRGATPEEVVGAMTAILDYLREFLSEQRKNPQSALMKGIVSARLDDGHALTDDEMLSIAYLLYIGGLDTVYSTIGWIFWYLAQDRPLQDRLREHPEQIMSATEELLRAFSATSTARRVKRDFEFHGVKMRAGDTVHTFLTLASRDPDVYDDPHVVDIDRKLPECAAAFIRASRSCGLGFPGPSPSRRQGWIAARARRIPRRPAASCREYICTAPPAMCRRTTCQETSAP